jgi:uncharacterized protein (DUF433 family)
MPVAKPELDVQSAVDVPLYTLWDAARYLHLPVWVVLALSGRGRPHPEWFLHHVWRRWPHFDPDNDNGFPFSEEFPRLSFRRLTEFFVRDCAVQAIRELGRAGEWKKDHWFRIHEMVWTVLEPYPGVEGLFGERETEAAISHLVERYVSRVPPIQPDWLRKLILRRIERVEVHASGPVRMYPFSRDPEEDSPRLIVIDPQIRFGRPTLAGRGIPTDIIVERFRAGDSPGEMADEYGISSGEVDEAIRYETLSTAPLFPPFFDW